MRRRSLILILFTFVASSSWSDDLPPDARVLMNEREAAIERLNQNLNLKLIEVKARCLRDGDLAGANVVDALIKGEAIASTPVEKDPMVNTVWDFLGTGKQKINQLTFLPSGKVKCESHYEEARWQRLDAITILFHYGTEGSYAILRKSTETPNYMAGSTVSGSARSIRLVE